MSKKASVRAKAKKASNRSNKLLKILERNILFRQGGFAILLITALVAFPLTVQWLSHTNSSQESLLFSTKSDQQCPGGIPFAIFGFGGTSGQGCTGGQNVSEDLHAIDGTEMKNFGDIKYDCKLEPDGNNDVVISGGGIAQVCFNKDGQTCQKTSSGAQCVSSTVNTSCYQINDTKTCSKTSGCFVSTNPPTMSGQPTFCSGAQKGPQCGTTGNNIPVFCPAGQVCEYDGAFGEYGCVQPKSGQTGPTSSCATFSDPNNVNSKRVPDDNLCQSGHCDPITFKCATPGTLNCQSIRSNNTVSDIKTCNNTSGCYYAENLGCVNASETTKGEA